MVILCVGEALTWWQHLCSVQAAHHRFALSQQGGGGRQSWGWRAARQCWEGIEPFRGHKALLSVCGHQPHLCSTRFCAVQKTDLSPRLYLRGWAHDFSIISKFMSWGFKNTSVTWRCPWNVSVVQCCSPCFYQQHPEMEQLKHPLWARTSLDWLEEAPKDLLEIFHLIFYSRVFAKVLYLEAWAHQHRLCAGRPHTFHVEMEESCQEPQGCRSATWETSLPSPAFPGHLLLHSFLGPQFLISKMGRIALPYQLHSIKIGGATAGEKILSIMARAGGYILHLSRKVCQSSTIEVLGPMRITPICRGQRRGRMGYPLLLGRMRPGWAPSEDHRTMQLQPSITD